MTDQTNDLPFDNTDAPFAVTPSEWLANGVHRNQFDTHMINGDDAIEFICKLCGGKSTQHGRTPDGATFRPCPVFSIVNRIGDGYNAADQEVLDRGGAFVWSGGSYNISDVAYFSTRQLAEGIALRLAGGGVRVQTHDRDAEYINPARIHAVIDMDAPAADAAARTALDEGAQPSSRHALPGRYKVD